MSYKDNYKSIQVNLSRKKYGELIKWLEDKADKDATSLNSIIIRTLLKEFKRYEKEKV